MKSYLLAAMLFVLPLGCRSNPNDPPNKLEPAVDAVLKLMDDRLALMHDVAVSKVILGLPTDDPKREDAILQAVEVDAKAANVDKAFAREFFAAQFAAAKLQQEAVKARADIPKPTDEGMKQAGETLKEARTKINDLNSKLLMALGKIDWANRGADARKLFAARGPEVLGRYSDKVRDQALKPLRPN